ncbi:MAG: hypothetical protein MJE68_21895 [Proteobacteria bacterium]|nr:hypothetical protein [Pseudomonadota bacterium]
MQYYNGTYLEEGLALLLDCIDGEVGASIAHNPGVGRIQLVSEQRPEGGIKGREGGRRSKILL